MSVSEAGWAMKGGPKIKKENMKKEIHVKLNVMRLSAKKLVSPSKTCNSGQARYSVASPAGFPL